MGRHGKTKGIDQVGEDQVDVALGLIRLLPFDASAIPAGMLNSFFLFFCLIIINLVFIDNFQNCKLTLCA